MSEPEAANDAAAGPNAVSARPSDYVSDRTFADFPISSLTLRGLADMGYATATPVQAATIDPAIAGRDLIVRAKTGTGKTCAFGVPMIERVDEGARVTQALVLTPTRELAVQVAQEVASIARYRDLRITAIYGGVGFGPQEDALRGGAEIVVGTPGRIMDHLRRGNLRLDAVRVSVLDEADEMLSMGFLEDVKKILDKASPARQTMLFSATLDASLRSFARTHMKEPDDIHLSHDGDNVDLITHILYETSPDYHKARALLDLIEQERPSSAIIFCNTREDVSTVYTYLDRQGLGVEMLSGELAQRERERVMARVKSGGVQFLVSTDVAARGIDISDLSHVIHYSLPEDPAVYLHRSGRTGRIGKSGTALALSGGADFNTRVSLEKVHKIAFEIRLLPTPEESARLRTERFARMLKDASGTMAFESYLDVVRAVKERPDGDTLLAVALRAFLDWDRRRRNADADRSAPEAGRGEAGRGEPGEDGTGGGRRDEPRRDDRHRDDRHRDDRHRDDRHRDDRRRADRHRDERHRDDRHRGDRRSPDGPRDAAHRAERPPSDLGNGPNPIAPSPVRSTAPEEARSTGRDAADPEGDADDEEVGPDELGAPGAGAAEGGQRKRRRRRRRRSGEGGAGGGAPAGGES